VRASFLGKAIEIGVPFLYKHEGQFVVQPTGDLLHWANVNDEAIAQAFAEGLKLQIEETLTRNEMIELPIPLPSELKKWREIVTEFDKTNYEKSLDGILDRLDGIVARVFKVPADDLDFIKTEFQSDPMLRRVRPNLPFTDRQVRGLRKGLGKSDRYTKAYKTRH